MNLHDDFFSQISLHLESIVSAIFCTDQVFGMSTKFYIVNILRITLLIFFIIYLCRGFSFLERFYAIRRHQTISMSLNKTDRNVKPVLLLRNCWNVIEYCLLSQSRIFNGQLQNFKHLMTRVISTTTMLPFITIPIRFRCIVGLL